MSQYPENSTVKQYFDSDGESRPLHYMIRNEPEWAENRIKEGDKAIAQRDELLAALQYHQEQTRPIQRTIDAIAKVMKP